MTQKEKVLSQLKKQRTVSMLTAVHHRIGNLRQVIKGLRDDGHEILTVTDRDADGVGFTAYKLAA